MFKNKKRKTSPKHWINSTIRNKSIKEATIGDYIPRFLPNSGFKNFRRVNKKTYDLTENQLTKRFMRPYLSCYCEKSLQLNSVYMLKMKFITNDILVILCGSNITLWNIKTNAHNDIALPDEYKYCESFDLAVSWPYFAIAGYVYEETDRGIYRYTIQVYELKNGLQVGRMPLYREKVDDANDINEDYDKLKVVIHPDTNHIIHWNHDVRVANFKTGKHILSWQYRDLQDVAIDKKRNQIAILYEEKKIDFISLKHNDFKKTKTINIASEKSFDRIMFKGDLCILVACPDPETGLANIKIFHYNKRIANFIEKREIELACAHGNSEFTMSIILNDYVIVLAADYCKYITILDNNGIVIQQIPIQENHPKIACNALGTIAIRDFYNKKINILDAVDNNTNVRGSLIQKLVHELQDKFESLENLSITKSQHYYTKESYNLWRDAFNKLYKLFRECNYCRDINAKIPQNLLFQMTLFLQEFIRLKYLPLKDILNLHAKRQQWETEIRKNLIVLFKCLDQILWRIPWYLCRKYPKTDFYENLKLECEKNTFTYKFILGMSTNYYCIDNRAKYFFIKSGLFYVLDGYKKAIQYYTKGLEFGPNPIAYYHRGGAYYNDGQFKNAIFDFSKVINNNIPIKRINSYFYRAKACFYAEKFEYETGAMNYCIKDLRVVLSSNLSNDLLKKINKFLKKACDLTKKTHPLIAIKLVELLNIFFEEYLPGVRQQCAESLEKQTFLKDISKW